MNEDLEEVKGKAMWFWGRKKREVQARGPSGLKTQGRKCACCTPRGKETSLAGGSEWHNGRISDMVKEVVEGRADQVRFEGHGKKLGFYYNGRKSEGFEQSKDMFRLVLKKIIQTALWRIGYMGVRAMRPIGRLGPR